MNILLTGTDAGAISRAVTEQRHRAGASALGSVMSLVIVCDEAAHYDAVRAAGDAAREHPSRILVVIARQADEETRADAEIRIGEAMPGEIIILRLYGELPKHAESLVSPLLLADTPVVAWWPGSAPKVPAKDAIGALAQRRITDAAASARPHQRLTRQHSGYVPGDTDFAWTRLTPWRSVLAAALDQPGTGKVTECAVEAAKNNPSAPLLAAWLGDRLDVPVTTGASKGPGISSVRLRTSGGDIELTRPDGRIATLRRPGQPDQPVALLRRATSELLGEELRRLDPDDIYATALARLSVEEG